MNEKINILERSSYTELVLCWGMVQIRLDLGQIWGGGDWKSDKFRPYAAINRELLKLP